MKTLYKQRTNGRSNLPNYDCYASILHITKYRYGMVRVPKTANKGQKNHKTKIEKILKENIEPSPRMINETLS